MVKILKSETVFTGRAFRVQHDVIELPGGKQVVYDTVAHNGAVAMLALAADGRILLVRQYRHAARHHLLELPAGTLGDGEAPEACAQRELREEVGMAPGSLTKLAEYFLAPGYSTERMWVYLARDLRPEQLPGDEDEDLEIVAMTLDESLVAIASGEIEDAKTILGLYLAREALAHKP